MASTTAETELKLRLSPADARRVSRLGLLRGIKSRSQLLENVYYDTPDHALAAQKTALRHRRIGDTWLITVKTAKVSKGGLSTRPEWEYPCAPGELDFSGVDHDALRKRLEMLRPVLVPLFATNFRRRTWMIEPHPDLSIELALDEGEIIATPADQDGMPPRRRPICEIELELKKGSALGLFDIGLRLADKLALMPENESKAQRGQRLYRGIPDAPMEAKPSRLDPALPPPTAFEQLAHGCLNHFLANAEGVRSADAVEYIHQARIALRRLRALLRVFSPLLPADFVLAYNEGWRRFADQLGSARDFDVLIEETLPSISRHYEGHDGIETFVEYAGARRQEAREAARTSFHQPALGQLTLRFLVDLARLDRQAPGCDHPNASHRHHHNERRDGDDNTPTLRDFAIRRLNKRLARIRRDAVATDHQSVEALHRLRIQFKRLRYSVEFFAPFFNTEAIGTYASELKSMQDSLGRINDLERALTVEAMAPDAVRCKLVSGWLSATQRAQIAQFPAIVKRFTALPAPWEPASRSTRDRAR